jgi:putative phage-type endonuclease
MKTHNLTQGSPEWHAYRLEHFNASDAPAMLGISQHETRTQLLHRLATGIAPEVDAATQRRFDDGHRFEALARPIAESIIGKELYPVVGSEGKLSASFDGLTMDESICFEHKTLNDKLRNIQSSDGLPAQYHAQIEQQLMVSGADKCLFMASKWASCGEVEDEVHIWVIKNQDMRNALVQGWTQFSIDLAEYKRKLAAGEIEPAKVEVIAAPVMDLPALSIQVNGSISLITNLQKFGARLNEFVANINKEPSDDQGFADAEQAIKKLQNAQNELEAAEANALAQTSDIDDMRKTVKLYADTARTTRLMLEKMVKARKESIRDEIVQAAGVAFSAHVESLESETRPIKLDVARPDFFGATKGKRTIERLRDAVDTTLANGKINADAIAKDVRAKLAWCKETSTGYGFLFNDLAQIISKPMDDFQLVVTSRIDKHKADEAARIEAETARIQAEATAKAEREAAAKMAQEEARIRAEEQAKVRAEAIALANKAPSKQVADSIEMALEKVQAEEDVLVTKQCEANAVGCNKPVNNVPTRAEIIELVAGSYNASLSLAEEWLCAEFAEVAA